VCNLWGTRDRHPFMLHPYRMTRSVTFTFRVPLWLALNCDESFMCTNRKKFLHPALRTPSQV
jgi:hypothetical protein